MPNSKTQVLIVGAGPTGLALANLLASLHVSFRIIDKNSQRSDKSKALGVQAGTLEAISYRLGKNLAEKMVAAGNKVQSAYFNFYDQAPVKVDLSLIPSLYNFILVLAQSDTEQCFEERLSELGSSVERQCELISLKENTDSVTAILKNKAGESETVEADFVIGCDGAHSMVRNQLEFPFSGGKYSGNFVLGDVKIENTDTKNALEVFMSEKGVLAYFPIKPDGFGRFILIPQNLAPSDSPEISLNEFSALLNELSPKPIHITEATWLTRFSIHHRLVNHLRKNRVFLAGDAAHIHSPVGGQGMNTGIQDVFNLGSKLGAVLSGKADLNSLDAYEKQRYPVAEQIVRGTDFASRYILLAHSGLARCFKQHLLPRLLSIKWIQKKLVTALSEVTIARKERHV